MSLKLFKMFSGNKREVMLERVLDAGYDISLGTGTNLAPGLSLEDSFRDAIIDSLVPYAKGNRNIVSVLLPNLRKDLRTDNSIPTQREMLPLINSMLFYSETKDQLPFVDPDSSRQVEIIWLDRLQLGLATTSNTFTLNNDEISNVMVKNDFIKLFDQSNVYDSPWGARGWMLNANGKTLDLLSVLELNGNGFNITIVGDPDKVKTAMKTFEDKYRNPSVLVVNKLVGFTDAGPALNRSDLREDRQLTPNIAFYPWLRDYGYESIDDLCEAYHNSPSNALLLIGPPGTGKSSLVRDMLFKLKRKGSYLVESESVLLAPGFTSFLNSLPEGSLLCAEDADRIISKRSDGNSQMSAILNNLEGVINTKNKFIISTNLPNLRSVDDALLRPGRSFHNLHFRKLTALEANLARESIGLEQLDIPEGEYSLAEAIHYERFIASEETEKASRSWGFGAQ